ncbi:39S ribosomal protein L50, mitochondrial isoform X2 [Sitophilus oryzae]|nr:39S ribosomal protein L50, mitochondrial isoform X2 [Sitophilus oryzae]
MAAFFKHGISKTGQILAPKNIFRQCYATKAEKKKGIDRKPGPKLTGTAESLATKGFLRPQKEYVPPADVNKTLSVIFQEVLGTEQLDTKVVDLNDRFKLFATCFSQIGHSIPNSLLHQIETLKDVVKFYETPVDVRTPYDKLKNVELPENLHVQHEYHRWLPDTDDRFGGLTAFPESSTIVTGLKYKGKYKGHKQTFRNLT